MATPAVEFHAATCSDVGLVRSSNQDSGYAGTNLLILTDGMGGPAGGDIASSVALAHLVPLDTDTHIADSMLALLRDALMDAHGEFSKRSRRSPDPEGLGTMCTAIVCSSSKLATVHIGDSRAYVLQGAALTQATTGHSFVQYLVETGQIALEEAEYHPNRNVVLRILGDSQADITPDETMYEAVLGDYQFLCSDGLSGVVSPETIGSTLAEIEDPGQYVEEPTRLALRAGGPDNVACVVADIANSDSFSPMPPQIIGAAILDRNAVSRRDSNAATRAVALGDKKGGDLDEDDLDLEEKWRPWLSFLITALATLVFAVTGQGGWAWTQSQYYMIGQGGYVVVHQGIPQSLGPWEFSHSIEVTDIVLRNSSPVDRQRLQDPVMRSPREQIDEYLAQLRSSSKTSGEGTENSQPGTSTSPDRVQSVRSRIDSGVPGSTVKA